MARNSAAAQHQAEEQKTGALAIVQGGDISVDLAGELDGLQGLGYSDRAEDSLIPILSILQDNSGEVKKNHSKRIDGAEPGMLIIRSLQRLFDGEDGNFIFQPCAFQHCWVEWNGEPGEGAPVAQYDFDARPEDAEEVEDPNDPERKFWRRPNGNRLVDTRYHFGHALLGEQVIPIVIPMAGTNHTVSRQWTSVMKEFRIPGSGQRAPAWFRAYAMRTEFQQRGSQSWYKYSVKDLGWVADAELRAAGRKMFESVSEQKVAVDIQGEADAIDPDASSGQASVHDSSIPV